MDKRYFSHHFPSCSPFRSFSLHTLFAMAISLCFVYSKRSEIIFLLSFSPCVCVYSRNEDKSRQQICQIFSTFRKFQQQQFIKCLFSAHPRSIQNWIGCQRKLLAINQKEFILMNLSIALHLLSYSPALTLAVLRRLTFSSNSGYFGPSKRVALYCFNFVAQFNF